MIVAVTVVAGVAAILASGLTQVAAAFPKFPLVFAAAVGLPQLAPAFPLGLTHFALIFAIVAGSPRYWACAATAGNMVAAAVVSPRTSVRILTLPSGLLRPQVTDASGENERREITLHEWRTTRRSPDVYQFDAL
jgi:hypothetical protein